MRRRRANPRASRHTDRPIACRSLADGQLDQADHVFASKRAISLLADHGLSSTAGFAAGFALGFNT